MSQSIALRNSSMSEQLPTLQFAWDSTSMGALKQCPRYYQYTILEGWTPRAESVHLTFGSHYHKAVELYAHLTAAGAEHEEALRAVVRHTLQATWDSKLNRPWSSDHKEKNRESLLRAIVWYLDEFSCTSDPCKTVVLSNGKPAVELSFRLETSHTMMTGEPVLWCGHLDRVVEFNSDIYISDHKTTTSALDERFFSKFSPDNQFSGYTFAGQIIYSLPLRGIIVSGVQLGATFARFRRELIMRHQSSLDEWYHSLGIYFRQAESYALANFWPQNEKSCGNYGGCPFAPVCSKPPEVRELWLKASYSKRVWDPLVTREVL